MAVRQIKTKDGVVWQAQINVAGMKRVTRNFTNETEARKFHDATRRDMEKEAKARDRKAIDGARIASAAQKFEDLYLVDVLKEFNAAGLAADEAMGPVDPLVTKRNNLKRKGKGRRPRASSARQRKSLPTVVKLANNVRISQIDEDWVNDYILKARSSTTIVGRQFAFATIAVHLQIMNAACRWKAYKLKQPCPLLPFSTSEVDGDWDHSRDRRLEMNEQRILIARLRKIKAPSRSHWVLLVRFALETGARLQELVLAEKSEFCQTLKGVVWNIPDAHVKTGYGRAVPLSKAAQRLYRLLRAMLIKSSERIFHTLGTPDSVSAGFHKYVFSTEIKDFKFHDLRHEATTRMLTNKRKMRELDIMRLIGHASLTQTERYTHIRADDLCELME